MNTKPGLNNSFPIQNSEILQGELLNMGRGRSKAKQTKVARDLKYGNQETDLEALAKELRSNKSKEDEIEAAWQELEKDN
ncbi:MAG: hypothetical protein RLZZ37_51 [Actinomycetota bacterium]